MGKRREVQERIEALKEIHTIMESMKNLTMMEMHKLARYHGTQQRAVDSISRSLNEVRYYFAPEMELAEAPLYLLFGSERGFCGTYNRQLLETLAQQPDHAMAPLIGVGARLAAALQRDYPHAVCLPGASVADEAARVLATVVYTFNRLRDEHGPLRLEVIHFQPGGQSPRCQPVMPPQAQPVRGMEPLINLPPRQLLAELIEHYLFAVTHTWFFAALMAENQRRIQHLDQAGHHLEHRVEELGKQRNVLRQEEIIEEIEVILLSSEMVGTPGV